MLLVFYTVVLVMQHGHTNTKFKLRDPFCVAQCDSDVHHCTPSAGESLTILACSYALEATALKCGGNPALSDLKFSSSPVRHVFLERCRLQYFLSSCAG